MEETSIIIKNWVKSKSKVVTGDVVPVTWLTSDWIQDVVSSFSGMEDKPDAGGTPFLIKDCAKRLVESKNKLVSLSLL